MKCPHGVDPIFMVPCQQCEIDQQQWLSVAHQRRALEVKRHSRNLFLEICHILKVDVAVKWLAEKFDRWDNKHEDD